MGQHASNRVKLQVIDPPHAQPSKREPSRVNRGHKVAALLLRCAQLVPDVFVLDSDGGWDTQWLTGHPASAGSVIASPRNLVGMLFEPYPDTSPFTDITQFLTRHR